MVSIRPFRASDQEAARALIEEGLGEHFGFVDRNANPDLVDIAASYATPPNAFFVAELDGTLVGTTGLIVQADIGRLVRVAVPRNHRRSGVATALLSYVTRFARQLGLSELVAYTQPEWPDAMSFYSSRGFAPYGHDEIDVYLRRSLVAATEPDGAQ
jgi:N-acetylglutamate synthase-like GNAT family acetyltransferase